ncbi:MAG: 3'-5' exonuclease [Spirochaetales bacterium]|nr:3'-5' exonuclease [Spirochaetales bacterium]
MKNLFIDLETTGLNPVENGIIQLSGIIEIDDEIKDTFDFHIKPFPGDKIDEKALEVNRRTKQELEHDSKYQDPLGVHKTLMSLLSKYIEKFDKKDKFNFIGYNSQAFDFPFLRSWFYKCKDNFFGSWFWSPSIDVMPIWAFILAKKRHVLDNFQLATVADYCGIKVDGSKIHDSLYDIQITRELYHKLRNNIIIENIFT